MVPTSRFVSRGALAEGAVAVLAFVSFRNDRGSPSRSPSTPRTKPRGEPPRTGNGQGEDQCPTDSAVPYERGARNNHHRYWRTLSLSRPAERSGHPLRRRRGTCRLPVVGRRAGVSQKQEWPDWRACRRKWSDDSPISAPVHGGWSGQSPRRASPLSRSCTVFRIHRTGQPGDDQARRFIGMLSSR